MIELLVLRLIHVLSGIFWVGSSMLMAGFLGPALGTLGPGAGPVMAALQRRRLMSILPVAALLTMLSGLRLLWVVSQGFSASWVASNAGRSYIAAGALAILAFVLGMALARPTAMRVGKLAGAMAGAPEAERPRLAAELARLRRLSTVSSTVVSAMLVIAAAGMAVARYVP